MTVTARVVFSHETPPEDIPLHKITSSIDWAESQQPLSKASWSRSHFVPSFVAYRNMSKHVCLSHHDEQIMWPQGTSTVSTSLVQQMVHTNSSSIFFTRRCSLVASFFAFARAALAFLTSSGVSKHPASAQQISEALSIAPVMTAICPVHKAQNMGAMRAPKVPKSRGDKGGD